MKISFSVDTPDMNLAKKEIIKRQKEVLYRSMIKMQEIAIKLAPVDIGDLRAGIKLFPELPGSTDYVLADGVEYGIDLEFGTTPHYVPIEPLKEWAKRKTGDEDFGYYVQKKIAEKGINAQPFFRPAFMQVTKIYYPNIAKSVFSRP